MIDRWSLAIIFLDTLTKGKFQEKIKKITFPFLNNLSSELLKGIDKITTKPEELDIIFKAINQAINETIAELANDPENTEHAESIIRIGPLIQSLLTGVDQNGKKISSADIFTAMHDILIDAKLSQDVVCVDNFSIARGRLLHATDNIETPLQNLCGAHIGNDENKSVKSNWEIFSDINKDILESTDTWISAKTKYFFSEFFKIGTIPIDEYTDSQRKKIYELCNDITNEINAHMKSISKISESEWGQVIKMQLTLDFIRTICDAKSNPSQKTELFVALKHKLMKWEPIIAGCAVNAFTNEFAIKSHDRSSGQ